MNILITHVYSKHNKGDAAILSAMLSQVKKAFPKAAIKILTTEKIKKGERFDKTSLSESFFTYAVYYSANPIIRTFNTLEMFFTTTASASIFYLFRKNVTFFLPEKVKDVYMLYKNANLILPVGGGYINGRKTFTSNVSLILILHALAIGLLLRKKTILYSQTIGPFTNAFQEYISSSVLNQVTHIFVREDYSIKTLKRIGVNKNIVTKTVDAAFLFTTQKKYKRQELQKKTVGITVRKWLTPEKQEKFEREIARFIDILSNKLKYKVILIPQVTASHQHDDDREISKSIANKIKYKNNLVVLTNNLTHQEIYAIYQHLDFLVGTRMHSVIFALTSTVPSIAIEYEYKTGGIMKDLGLSEFVIKIENVTALKLEVLFKKLVKEEKSYRKILLKSLENYKEKAKETMDSVKNYYYTK